MNIDPLTPDDTTVVLVDYAVGFANVLRSHSLGEHINDVVGLAKTALAYGSGLVVTNGADSRPSGPLYPELTEAIGDTPVIVRHGGDAFNSFLDQGFAEAVRLAGAQPAHGSAPADHDDERAHVLRRRRRGTTDGCCRGVSRSSRRTGLAEPQGSANPRFEPAPPLPHREVL